MTDRQIIVHDPGSLTTIQDRGRPGHAHLGVPRSGALDPAAADLANRLVGNDDDAAVLETMVGGLEFTSSSALTIAVTGAPCDVAVDGRPRANAEPVSVGSGESVRVGPLQWGLRCYVALSGGLDVPAVLGSRSTDTLSGLGPGPLARDDRLSVGVPTGRPRALDVSLVRRPLSPVALRFILGPREDWFTAGAVETLTGSTYTVSADSNRVGLRLEGPPLERSRTEELESEGIVLGAIQVPASGMPLVFLNDHPTTGGYPVVGVVAPEDLPRCAQLRPGDEVVLRPQPPTGSA